MQPSETIFGMYAAVQWRPPNSLLSKTPPLSKVALEFKTALPFLGQITWDLSQIYAPCTVQYQKAYDHLLTTHYVNA